MTIMHDEAFRQPVAGPWTEAYVNRRSTSDR